MRSNATVFLMRVKYNCVRPCTVNEVVDWVFVHVSVVILSEPAFHTKGQVHTQ